MEDDSIVDDVDDLRAFLSIHLELSAEEMARFTPYVTKVRYEAGETIVAEGRPCRTVVIAMSGFARAYYVHGDKEVNLRLVRGPAAVVALASLITGEPSQETLQALSPITGYRSRLRDYETDHPGAVADRVRRVLAEQHYLSMDRRLRTLQYKTARERYAYFCEHMEPEIVRGVAGYHVASYLGVTPESLSRVRARVGRS